jgi:hypothetical protein
MLRLWRCGKLTLTADLPGVDPYGFEGDHRERRLDHPGGEAFPAVQASMGHPEGAWWWHPAFVPRLSVTRDTESDDLRGDFPSRHYPDQVLGVAFRSLDLLASQPFGSLALLAGLIHYRARWRRRQGAQSTNRVESTMPPAEASRGTPEAPASGTTPRWRTATQAFLHYFLGMAGQDPARGRIQTGDQLDEYAVQRLPPVLARR